VVAPFDRGQTFKLKDAFCSSSSANLIPHRIDLEPKAQRKN